MTADGEDEPPSVAEIEPFESDEIDGEMPDDLDEAVTAEWKATSTAFQRIHTVLKNTYEPHTTGEIAEKAATTKPTVRKHVEPLLDAGMVEARATGNLTRYMWNPRQRRVNRVAELASDHTPTELDAKLRRAKARIAELEREYTVGSPSRLAEELDPDDDEGWNDLSTWRTLEDDRKRLEAAQSMKEYLGDPESMVGRTDAANHA